MKYKKKPIVVDAYQTSVPMTIHTLEGDMKANVGDYIITGIKGEQYPCKQDIFEELYEPVEEVTLDDQKIETLELVLDAGFTKLYMVNGDPLNLLATKDHINWHVVTIPNFEDFMEV